MKTTDLIPCLHAFQACCPSVFAIQRVCHCCPESLSLLSKEVAAVSGSGNLHSPCNGPFARRPCFCWSVRPQRWPWTSPGSSRTGCSSSSPSISSKLPSRASTWRATRSAAPGWVCPLLRLQLLLLWGGWVRRLTAHALCRPGVRGLLPDFAIQIVNVPTFISHACGSECQWDEFAWKVGRARLLKMPVGPTCLKSQRDLFA